MYDPKLPVQIKSDVAGTAVGAVLEHLHDNAWHPIEYFSKRLNDTESKYSATEYEMLVYILVVDYCYLYLVGQAFDVLTDHVPK